jgi:hypothetical protein
MQEVLQHWTVITYPGNKHFDCGNPVLNAFGAVPMFLGIQHILAA